MFSVKFFNNKNIDKTSFSNTVTNIVNYICDKISVSNTRVISDSSSVEIISGRESAGEGDDVVIELLIKKTIIINNSDFKDREALDRHITKIKHFCEQAKSIEELKYLPINMR